VGLHFERARSVERRRVHQDVRRAAVIGRRTRVSPRLTRSFANVSLGPVLPTRGIV
jgi:hypothetical protein